MKDLLYQKINDLELELEQIKEELDKYIKNDTEPVTIKKKSKYRASKDADKIVELTDKFFFNYGKELTERVVCDLCKKHCN